MAEEVIFSVTIEISNHEIGVIAVKHRLIGQICLLGKSSIPIGQEHLSHYIIVVSPTSFFLAEEVIFSITIEISNHEIGVIPVKNPWIGQICLLGKGVCKCGYEFITIEGVTTSATIECVTTSATIEGIIPWTSLENVSILCASDIIVFYIRDLNKNLTSNTIPDMICI